MITLLKNQSEVESAVTFLNERKIPLHFTRQKNWDHVCVVNELNRVKRDVKVLDMGSGDGYTLRLLRKLGYRKIQGIDFSKPILRRRQRWLRKFWPFGYTGEHDIVVGDLCDTPFEDEGFDVLTCVSVIEHGVDLERFFRECGRLLKNEGKLIVTFDYWHDFDQGLLVEERIFDLPWCVFNTEMVDEMIGMAAQYGLVVAGEREMPRCEETTVRYRGFDYTFMCVIFEKMNTT
ncbi:putative S-adenosylmethionine-dependent methyltransferase/MSMEI_2290 [Poriferisphaera corsica]|uniref:Putative S-adenosylmethionine-dependent methyltransferase/MSMEI_2290 n=1 Tax=Poriferisphaera corsica TaxID=2528020 RepID=A0A517YPA5_9BACT|nr:class I SAM-dependent methyltransferase [Poriferisphaera corsica]QDU32058.1 putative S-adenosylmethionine-dependent methyltransferase/MSMEI_2290 [Poriferisphaera corsica]